MAAPAANNGVNITDNNTAMQTPSPENCHFYNGPGIYIVDVAESNLFYQWLVLSHLEIHIAEYKEAWHSHLPPSIFALTAKVAENITPEQEKRFALVAQTRDIEVIQDKLQRSRAEKVEIQGVLEADKEDQLTNFDAEDFKRMEKEDRLHREPR